MRKFLRVAKYEYLKLVQKRSFILTSLGFPALIAIIIAISIFAVLGKQSDLPVGFVDYAGVFTEDFMDLPILPTLEDKKAVVFQAFDSSPAALEELRADLLQAVYVLPSDYIQSGKVELYYSGQRPSESIQQEFEDFVKMNLLSDHPPEVQFRLINGTNLIVRSADNNREFDSHNIIAFFIPFVAAFLFVIAVMSAGGYMLEAVTKEKENRTIEILATSLKPEALIGGKALGLMGVGLTQLVLWALTGVAGLLVLGQYYDLLRAVQIPWSTLAIVGIFFLPAYALMAGMMTIIGSMVTDSKQGQQISGIINLLFTSPFFFMTLIMAKPNHPVAIGLSLFPTTAFITITMRWAMTTIPTWQLITSFVILTTFAGLSIWIAARVFRLGMLRYGQNLNLKHMLKAFRGQ